MQLTDKALDFDVLIIFFPFFVIQQPEISLNRISRLYFQLMSMR